MTNRQRTIWSNAVEQRLADAVIQILGDDGHDGGCHEEGHACRFCVLVEKAERAKAAADFIPIPPSAWEGLLRRVDSIAYLGDPDDVAFAVNELQDILERQAWGELIQ